MIINIRIIKCIILLILFLMINGAQDFLSESNFSEINITLTFTERSGEFIYHIYNIDNSKYILIIKIIPNNKDAVTIIDEANSLSKFLERILSNNINIKGNIAAIHIGYSFEQEVRARLLKSAAESKEWMNMPNNVTVGIKYDIIEKLLLSSNSYQEINEVLNKYNLRIKSFGVEDVIYKVVRSKRLPYIPEISIFLEPIVKLKS